MPRNPHQQLTTWIGAIGAMALAPPYLHALGMKRGDLLIVDSPAAQWSEACPITALTTGLLCYWLLHLYWKPRPEPMTKLGFLFLAALLGSLNAGATLAVHALCFGEVDTALFGLLFGSLIALLTGLGSGAGVAIGLALLLPCVWTEYLEQRDALDTRDWLCIGLGLWLTPMAAWVQISGPADLLHPTGALISLLSLGLPMFGLISQIRRRLWLERVLGGLEDDFAVVRREALDPELPALSAWTCIGKPGQQILVRRLQQDPYRGAQLEPIAWVRA